MGWQNPKSGDVSTEIDDECSVVSVLRWAAPIVGEVTQRIMGEPTRAWTEEENDLLRAVGQQMEAAGRLLRFHAGDIVPDSADGARADAG